MLLSFETVKQLNYSKEAELRLLAASRLAGPVTVILLRNGSVDISVSQVFCFQFSLNCINQPQLVSLLEIYGDSVDNRA